MLAWKKVKKQLRQARFERGTWTIEDEFGYHLGLSCSYGQMRRWIAEGRVYYQEHETNKIVKVKSHKQLIPDMACIRVRANKAGTRRSRFLWLVDIYGKSFEWGCNLEIHEQTRHP